MNIGIIVIINFSDRDKIHPVFIQTDNTNNKWLIIARDGMHYNGLKYIDSNYVPTSKVQKTSESSKENSINLCKNVEIINESSKNAPVYTCQQSSNYVKSLSSKLSKHIGLNIMNVNCRSLLPKIEEITLLVLQTNADVMCISETWLDNSVCNESIKIDGYNIIHKDRNHKKEVVC